jgi:pSer/pThr/pTyr-binding forkhead associated (FHA) protein
MSRLAIYRGDQFLEEVVLARAVMGLGRHPENDIVLDDKTLSRFHARVERRGDRFVVVDLGAQNGVHLNGQRIQGESGLEPGDRISLGRYVAVFEPVRDKPKADDLDLDVELDDLLEADRTKNVRPEKDKEKEKGTDVVQPSGAREPVLVLLFNGMEVSRHVIGSTGSIVGRSKNADVVISLLGLSRKHARISKADDGAVVVEDLGSQNGTWVNNQRIPGPKKLRHGDLLNFYDYAVLFLEDGSVDVGFPGAGFRPPEASSGVDDLASQETGRGPQSPAARRAPATPTRGVVPLADSDVGAIAKSAAEALDLGEGSFLGEDFEDDDKSGASSLLDEDPLDVAELLPDTRAGVDKPKRSAFDDLPGTAASGEDFSAEAAFAAAGAFADDPGTEGDVLKFEDRTSTTNASENGRAVWASDRDLLKALAHLAESVLVTVEVTLGGKPYTQMPLSQTVTRVGSDPRCELSLPKSSGVLPWHLTLLHLGGAVVLYRGGRSGQILLAEQAVDMAVLQDGDMLDLGKVRLKLKMR